MKPGPGRCSGCREPVIGVRHLAADTTAHLALDSGHVTDDYRLPPGAAYVPHICQFIRDHLTKEHAMSLSTVQPISQGDSENRTHPREHFGQVMVVNVVKVAEEVATKNGPATGIEVHAAVPSTGEVYRDQLWFGGPIVDVLKPAVGTLTCFVPKEATAKSGRRYALLDPATPAQIVEAERWLAANPAALGEQVGTVGAAEDKPPF